MKVKAICKSQAWDSTSCTMYYPGGEYEIDHDGPLAALKIRSGYVFEFDRNPCINAEGVNVEKDYTCKHCGDEFKSLAALGNHTNKHHKDADLIPDDEPVPEPELNFACDQCPKKFKDLRGLNGHVRFAHKKKAEAAETVAVPA